MKKALLTQSVRRRLESAAKAASREAYAPYSKFRVGAAVLTDEGQIFAGCNVENASYPLCSCAERTAITSAVAAGHRKLQAVVVYTPTAEPVSPCGACRQIINEFGPNCVVISTCASGKRQETLVSALLIHSFGPSDLKPKKRGKKPRK